MRSGRLGRFVAGLGFGYLHTVVALVVGIFLTPYVLGHLGTRDYGLWLLGAQVLAYLSLMDVGVVALVPREVAFAVGQGRGSDAADVRALVGRTMGVVWWQLPLVAVLALATWLLLPGEWALLRGPLGVVLVAFVALFPARVCPALLQGLQDLGYLGGAQLAGLVLGTLTTILAVWAGAGLYALAVGWIVTQAVPAVSSWLRIRRVHAHVWPRGAARATLTDARQQLSRGAWISVSQIAQVLLTGTDVLVVGATAGPEAVVVYVCTGRLIAILANQPQMLMQTALPALSELRGAAARDRLEAVSRSMAQLLFLASGAIVVLVLMVNASFVRWWVGDARFGGVGLTAALVAGMLVRQVNFAAIYTLFCFGYERRLALTAVADGVVGGVAMVLLVPAVGPLGAAIGLLLATVTVSLPANLRALGRELGVPPLAFLRFWRPWALRFAVVLLAATAVAVTVPGGDVWTLAVAGGGVMVLYALVMLPELLRAPLGPMLRERLTALGLTAPWATRLLPNPSTE